MQKSVEITITKTYTFSYDTQSEAFKNALDSYKVSIDKKGDELKMLKAVALSVDQYGAKEVVDGVGHIQVQGVHQGDIDCGINMVYDEPEVDVELI